MGIYVIKMPDIGEGIAEVELVEWMVKEGDTVAEDQVLAEVMTEKATVEVPSPVHGTVLALGGAVGEIMAVGAELIRLEVEGEGNVAEDETPAVETEVQGEDHMAGEGVAPEPEADLNSQPDADSGESQEALPQEEAASDSAAATMTGAAANGQPEVAAATDEQVQAQPPAQAPQHIQHQAVAQGRPLASPAVRRRAMEAGIDLQVVPATGAQGQVTQQDLDNWLRQSGAGASAGDTKLTPAPTVAYTRREGVEEIPVVGLRRKIAEKMQQSKRQIPHFTYVEEVDVTELEALRQTLNQRWGESRGKLTLLPFIVRAMVLAINDFPQMNARFDDEKGVVSRYVPVHLGVAAQTDSGLMVPVLRHAEAYDLWGCAGEIRRLAQAARDGSAHRDELSGSTITLTSLGALGGIVSTPVINYPEVAIVGVNRVVEKPVVMNGAIVVRKTMNLSSSFDHRVVDGMHAAEFIQCIRGLLECPSLLFVQ
ncbi:dihydrolipoamide acetyltransferase family protein [Achromobacter sp. F4_2707]|uniref:dihydrolipoamide acetyltransferase family protein n=1 Tax=Achromobacter sp. F4_2707 TaxID=3114286 RepID=UPI0039C72181